MQGRAYPQGRIPYELTGTRVEWTEGLDVLVNRARRAVGIRVVEGNTHHDPARGIDGDT